ncbi:hypothetical protein MC7420_191 [Coleofasciculus chthonoplastes PCC 7420]|uniref:Uncharacterized protein n=1 Tax=Coleofasciculus chthonoplastes PCC 7420 TaxID=118168 RepID=B4VL36_9CYAN|nr:hypothetical protein MC7420_191 [Coleofasciculus chthonoplastes PCC 7420]
MNSLFPEKSNQFAHEIRELRKNKVPVRKAVLINLVKLDWYIIKPQVPYPVEETCLRLL